MDGIKSGESKRKEKEDEGKKHVNKRVSWKKSESVLQYVEIGHTAIRNAFWCVEEAQVVT